MISNRIGLSLQNDTRAVSSLIGFILLFGILVTAFVGYQAQVVPQQNAETEFKHFQENQDELIELRSSILTAGTSDRPQFPTVQLGTNYRTRVLALNGPPPAGILQTSPAYPINISNSSNGTDNIVVETRFIQYKPGYYEIDVGSTWYENSVLYLDETESGGGRVVIEDQSLVTDGDTLRITALQNDFQRSGTNRITLELYPTTVEGNISDLPEDQELTVELPTRLGSDYWSGQFNNSSSVAYDDFNDSDKGVNEIILTVDSVDNLELNTVGISEEPTESPAKNIPSPSGSGGSGGSGGGGGGGDGGTTLPDGNSAFNDANGNGVYDDGVDTAYTEDEIGDANLDNTDLVIEQDTTTDGIQQQKLASLTIKDGVTVKTTNDKLRFRVNGGSIDVSGATLISTNNAEIQLKISEGNGDINIEDARLESNGNIKAEGKGGQNNKLFANNNGGDENDGGTYVVNNNDDPADLSVNQIDTSSASLERGNIN